MQTRLQSLPIFHYKCQNVLTFSHFKSNIVLHDSCISWTFVIFGKLLPQISKRHRYKYKNVKNPEQQVISEYKIFCGTFSLVVQLFIASNNSATQIGTQLELLVSVASIYSYRSTVLKSGLIQFLFIRSSSLEPLEPIRILFLTQ